jgi:intein/homing endonuclease
MTIAMLIEMLSGVKVTASSQLNQIKIGKPYGGSEGDPSEGQDDKKKCKAPDGGYGKFKGDRDATPFDKSYSLDRIMKEIKKLGIAGFSEVLCYHPHTGLPQKVLTFRGMCSYQKLRHMVVGKIHARSRGGRTLLTRQPKEGRKVGGGFRVGHMERDCQSAGTPILLADGVCVRIETLSTFSDVYGWDLKKDGIVVDKQTNFAHKGKRTCYRITLKDGRTIDATRNHPFLTAENEWSDLKDLRVNEDFLQVSINGPLVEMENDMKDCDGWNLKLGDYHFKTNDTNNYLKTLAFARLLGLIVTDSFVPEKKAKIRMSLGHLLDVEWVIRDLKILGICDLKQGKAGMTKNTYVIYLPIDFSDVIRSIPGVISGPKVDKKARLPKFIMKDCPRPIIREFLGAYFGGDGHTCCLSNHRGKRDLMKSVSLSETKSEKRISSLIRKMESIQLLLEKCGVNGATIQTPKETTNSKSRTNVKNQEVVLNIPLENLIDFSEKIGFRYCVHKLVRLEAGVSYRRFREGCLLQRQKIVDRTREIIKEESLNIQKALLKAISNIEDEAPILHDLAIPNYYCAQRLLRGDIKNVYRSGGFPTVEEYLKEIDALKFFSEETGDMVYGVHRDSKAVPTFSLQVIDVREIGKNDVYDITVDKTHSFVANGVVSHNCLLANGCPAFVRDRLMEQSDEYRMHYCKVCGLPATVVKGNPQEDIPESKECKVCQSTDIAYIRLPYATKLLMFEFMGMGIVFRVLTDPYEEPTLEPVNVRPDSKIAKKLKKVYEPVIEEMTNALKGGKKKKGKK